LAGVTSCDPLVALAPFHPPLAVHPVALVLDHVKVVGWPALMLAGFAENVTVGAGSSPSLPVEDEHARPMVSRTASQSALRINLPPSKPGHRTWHRRKNEATAPPVAVVTMGPPRGA
jgi:hypothetical protein